MIKRYFFCPLMFFLTCTVSAEDLATLYSSEGHVEGSFVKNAKWTVVNTGQTFNENDQVRTLDNSRAGIKFRDGFLIRLSPKASVNFSGKTDAGSIVPVSVLSGITHFLSRKSQAFPKINTPHVSASVRGTEFTIEVTDKQTKVSVLEGEVFLENQFGSSSVSKGEVAITESGKAPVKSIMIDPVGSVEWALYYPPTVDVSQFTAMFEKSKFSDAFNLLGKNSASAREKFNDQTELSVLGRSLSYYSEGQYSRALEEVNAIANTSSAEILLYISALKLSLGDVPGAEQIHAKIKTLGLNASESSSLLASQRAIIYLAKNDDQKARSLVKTALQTKSNDETLLLVASYLDQADHDLESARDKLKIILKNNPKHQLAKARLAEIYLAFGERDEALSLLGTDKEVKSSYGQAVLGFSYLTQKESDSAIKAFTKAIELDQSSALPHLGLGLAYISQGDLVKGRTELEYAVQLEPTVAIYRSYLGKAYFEEASGTNANKEFKRAMELDPEDPTPYLYRSYLNLVEHKPVAALRDIQSSIEKNDNRAVYRSSLMLDNDSATRTNGLGRIYSRVGFTELARVEAVKSLHKDYSNYSSHYLLGTLLSETHLNSRAQATENLLGRLLSPVTFNANNLSIGGEASLNEYTTLFDAPTERTVLGASGDTVLKSAGGGIEHIRNTENLGMNFGYSYDYRGGFRDNDFERNQQLFSLGQYKLNADSNLVWDSAVTANDRGDLLVSRDQYEEDRDIDNDFESALVRGGYHLRVSPSTHFIAQAFYNYGDTKVDDPNNSSRISSLNIIDNGAPTTMNPFRFDGLIDEGLKRKENLGQLDAQFMIDKNLVSIVTGSSFRYSSIDGQENGVVSNYGSTPGLSSLQGFPIYSQNTNDQLTSRTYLYSTWHLTKDLDVDAGLTYTWLDFSENAVDAPFVDDGYQRDSLDPKLGFLYQLTSSTSLRGAYAETLDRTDRGNIGPLEPTFVGGFNQVFDGLQGSKQDFWGLGLDQTLSTETYVGVNYQNRKIDLNSPFVASRLAFDRSNGQVSEERFQDVTNAGADEEKVGAYIYQILNEQFTLILDYSWEYFKEIDPLPESDTSKFGSQLNYFHPSGLFALGRAGYRMQKQASGFEEQESDNFLLVDLGVGYEFDERKGAVTLLFNNIFDKSFQYSAIRDEQAIRPDWSCLKSHLFILGMRFKYLKGISSKVSVIILGVLLSSIFLSIFGNSLNNYVYDYLFVVRGSSDISNEVVIVAIDEPSFEEINMQWPWPRSIHADLLSSLTKAGVKTIGFDLLFAEPSEEDEAFAKALSNFPHAVLVNDISSISDPTHGISGESITEPSSIIEHMTMPLQMGFANMQVDTDGYIRSLDVKRDEIYSLSYMLSKDFLGQFGKSLEIDNFEGKRYIDFLGPPKTIKTISYYQALDPEKYLPKDFLKDKLVLVGFATASQATSSMSVIDHYLAPYSRGGGGYYPGVEIHAHATAGFLADRHIECADISTLWILGIVLGIVWGGLIVYSSLMYGTIISLGLLGFSIYLVYTEFANALWYISPLYLLGPTVFILLLNPFLQYLNSLQQRKFLRDAFSTYLAPQVVKQIISNPESLSLGGIELESTILFLDVAGFTAISEKVTASELISFVNRTLGRLSEIILKHEGMIDKFIGDCIMAGWGLPVPTTDHARRASEATLEILKELPKIVELEKTSSGADLSVRIGLSTGTVVAGNVGGGKRFNYTALGNDVNLASRLESLNKYYGTSVLVSEKTKESAGSGFNFRRIDRIRVKGQNQPVCIYELRLDPERNLVEKYEEALESYFRKDFLLAREIFSELAEQGDAPSAVLLTRCNEYLESSPSDQWDGVYTMKEK